MTFQYSQALVDARLNQIQSIVGAAGVLKIFSGAEPANCNAADPTGLLCTISLPATFLNAASGGQATQANGPWTGTGAVGAGSGTAAASWRIYDNGGTCHVQGNTTDMTFNNTSIASGQAVQITGFTITSANYP